MTAEDRMTRAAAICLSIVGISIALLILGLVAAFAHDHKPAHASLHDRFYKTWMMPDNRAMSCCHDKDCEPSASKFVSGKWYAQRNGEWIEVPNQKVETERDSPDGQSHYCGAKVNGSWYTYCFLPAPGS